MIFLLLLFCQKLAQFCCGDRPDMESGSPGLKKRGNWHHQLDCVLSLIGYCVGLGNLWRFPFKCYKNGGGAFLIPYFTCLLICGVPLYYMELSLGQFTSRGPVGAFEMAPLFKGIGFGMVIICWLCCIYYNVVVAWILYYLYNSFSSELPWASCTSSWNTKNCSNFKYECNKNGNEMVGYECLSNASDVDRANAPKVKWVAASEEFWKNHVLNQTSGIAEFDGFQWHLVYCLGVAWILVYFCMLKGIKSSGKVVYVTATLPYILLIILLVQTLQLEGAMVGVEYYLTPQWNKLLEPTVWSDAAQQIFYSLGLAFGCLMTMASYNKFKNNIARDAVLVCTVNCFTSVLGGFVIFSVIGFMSVETGQPMSEVASEGAGLAFVVYPEAVVRLPGAPMWSVIFFLMLLSLGLDSQFSMFETVTTALFDKFPRARSYKPAVVAVMCLFMFVIALPMVTRSGIYWLTIFDTYSAGFSLMFLCLFEIACVVYTYGVDRFSGDIEMMIDSRPGFAVKLCWMFITPVSMTAIFIFNMYNYAPASFEGQPFPLWADLMGWGLTLLSILMVPIMAVTEFATTEGDSLIQKIRNGLSPSPKWGPAEPVDRIDYERKLNEDADLDSQTKPEMGEEIRETGENSKQVPTSSYV